MSATRPVIRFGKIVRAVVEDSRVHPETWNGVAWEPGGDLRDVVAGRVLSRPELAAHGIPFDPDTLDQRVIRERGWNRES